MCGISGIFNFKGQIVEISVLKNMSDIMAHRGPDGDGFWINDGANIGFAHRRLAIIDLSDAGKQPMHYNDRYTITYNGEIYNYIELRKDLEKAGYHFRTHSDTEVILASFDFKKEKCVEDFDGMFAFAIWDKKERKLFCARDRFGEKPFHYYLDNERFVFASEIKSIFKANVRNEIESSKVDMYLSQGESVFYDSTFFKNICKLPPAHYAYVQYGKISIHSYYSIHTEDKNSYKSDAEYAERFLELFTTSLKRRMRSDVPIGSSLSGGLDSSGIVSVLHKINPNLDYKLFSARFNDPEKDEGKWMQMVVDQVKHPHYNIWVTPELILENIEDIVWHHEIPVGSTSVCAHYLLMDVIKEQNTKVILDGQGADEILAGYGHYRHVYLYNELYNLRINNFFKQKKIYKSLYGKKISTGYIPIVSLYLSKLLYPGKDDTPLYRSLKAWLKHDTVFNLPLLLQFSDRNSMSHGIEARLPFLFHELVDFVMSLPVNQIYRDAITKVVFRNAIRGIAPEPIVNRMDKLGFAPPQDKWMQHFGIPEKNELTEQGYSQSSYPWRNYITHTFLKVAKTM